MRYRDNRSNMRIIPYLKTNLSSSASIRILKLCLALALSTNSTNMQAQILSDSTAIGIITKGIHDIYNIEFEEAGKAYNALSKLYPGHPVLHLFNGMKIYWENFPMLPISAARSTFEKEMRKCIELSDIDDCPSPEYEAEYLLSNICARGLLLLFYSDNDLSGEVIPLVKSTYRPLMRSFNFNSVCPDLYYFTGVYNYYREAYPIVHPVYKAVAFMFPSGDMETGLQQLENCGKNSMALRAEAISMLSWIKMNFETNYKEALPYSRHLVNQYPSNPLFKVYLIKNQLLLKQYDEAERLIGATRKADSNAFFQAALYILNGIIQEKKYHNYNVAMNLYKEGIDRISIFGAYGDEYAAYGYFGLSRIGEESTDNHERRLNHRKAMDLVDFKKITFDD